ncbi:MAG: hypothetical protein ACREGH_00325 [Minisyncoccia bacterium]
MTRSVVEQKCGVWTGHETLSIKYPHPGIFQSMTSTTSGAEKKDGTHFDQTHTLTRTSVTSSISKTVTSTDTVHLTRPAGTLNVLLPMQAQRAIITAAESDVHKFSFSVVGSNGHIIRDDIVIGRQINPDEHAPPLLHRPGWQIGITERKNVDVVLQSTEIMLDNGIVLKDVVHYPVSMIIRLTRVESLPACRQ